MPALDEGIKLSDEALAEMIAAVYRGEWDIDAVAESRILAETRAIFRKAVERGVPRSKAHRKAFKERLNESVDVFSTFRVHNEADEIARMLTDEEGRRRTFRDWAERVQPYLNHQNRAWLQTEYSTAIRRAHDEAEWERFMEDADIYPNLEWMPSTSAQPGADHKIFWGTVLSKDDPFWSEHRPGDRWNCKCSLRQTDKEADKPGVRWKRGKGDEPQAGLRTKPGSGEIFSDDHPYFPKSCGECPYGSQAGRLRLFWHELTQGRGNCYNCLLRIKCQNEEARRSHAELVEKRKAEYERLKADPDYTDVEFNPKTGALKATHVEHNFDKKRGWYEKTVQDVGFRTGHSAILGKEDHTVKHKKNTEGTWDDKLFEIGAIETGTSSNIKNALKHCASKPGCAIAILFAPQKIDLKEFSIGLQRYNGLKGTPQWKQFDMIIVIEGNHIKITVALQK